MLVVLILILSLSSQMMMSTLSVATRSSTDKLPGKAKSDQRANRWKNSKNDRNIQ